MKNAWKNYFLVSLALLVLSSGLAVNFLIVSNTTKQTLAHTEAQLASTQTQLATSIAEHDITKTKLVNTEVQLSTTKSQLSEKETQLVATQGELSTTKTLLVTTQGELSTTKTQLVTTQGELSTTKTQLVATQGELSTTKTQLAATQGELSTTRTQLQTATAEKNLMLGQYANLRDLINARFGSTMLDRQRYITPYHPVVNSTVVVNWGVPVDDLKKLWQVYDSMLKWVVSNIRYSYDSYTPLMPPSVSGSITWVSDFWRMPVETLVDQTGDCEDMALLLASMMLNYNQNKYALWVIEIDSNVLGVPGHAAVVLPVAGGRLSILDPAGLYYTGMYQYNQLTSDVAASALNNWLSHWSQQIPGAYVSRIFSQSEDRQFSSNAEFLSWLSQR